MAFYYPNGKKYVPREVKTEQKSNNNIYSNRGMTLEQDINESNLYYLERDIAVIHKKPTPVQIVNVNYPRRSAAVITEAYFKQASTTDYNGIYKGKYIDFEAKETKNKSSFPLQNFHEHQIIHMEKVKLQGGISFVIFLFSPTEETYLCDSDVIIHFWKEQLKGGRKSIPKEIIQEKGKKVAYGLMPRLDYIKTIEKLYF